MTRKILILGTGGNSIEILEAVEEMHRQDPKNGIRCVGFLDDNPSMVSRQLAGIEILGPLSKAHEYKDCYFVLGIGSVKTFHLRKSILEKLSLPEDRFQNIVHPSAVVSRRAKLGAGSVLLQNVTVSADAVLEPHSIVLPNSVVSHGTFVGAFSCIAAGVCLSGGVKIGESCYIGSNTTVREYISIGQGALVGMGSCVVQDVPPFSKVMGNPAHHRSSNLEKL